MATIELYEAMRTLRAVRRLRPDPIPSDVLRRVLEAATWAPSGGNRQPWRVILVKDPSRKQRLGELYKSIAVPFMQTYSQRLAALPEGERPKQAGHRVGPNEAQYLIRGPLHRLARTFQPVFNGVGGRACPAPGRVAHLARHLGGPTGEVVNPFLNLSREAGVPLLRVAGRVQ